MTNQPSLNIIFDRPVRYRNKHFAGKMSDDDKVLTRNLSFIKDNITDMDGVMDKLIEDDILRLEDRSRILINRNPRLQIHAVLEIVVKKGAYDNFIRALETSGNNHIIERLENADLKCEKTDLSKEDKQLGLDQSDGCGNNGNHIQTEQSDKFQKQLKNLQSENEHLRDQQKSVRMELESKQKKMQELNTEVNAFKAQNKQLNERLKLLCNSDKLKDRLSNIELEIKERDEEHEIIETEIQEKENEVQQLQDDCNKLRLELAEKTDQLVVLSEQMKALREDLGIARKERYDLKVKLDEMNMNLNEKWKVMMNVLENKLSQSRRIPTRLSSEQKELMLPTIRSNQTTPLKIVDNRYSITPKEKIKSRTQQAQAVSPKNVVRDKKTAFFGTKPRSFNKFLK
ncbi:putative leucine-rich repeat-containing protein DDB_G0290503 [Mytilus californianus]|uniref:putative leucine-rich repeat-containing protein DDB_G0290503 n=1 Tax=Mytilus californianus TaxID=6549 RepID=UPI0022465C6B|nr:putative leucine-rich repeat-containing protein DDB_G0290503 [Mytilus californianus]